MPYNILNPGSIEDAWNQPPQSVFNEEQNKDKVVQNVQQGLLNNAMQNYTGNVELNTAPQVQPAAPTSATQMAAQGGNVARRKPTAEEYAVGVVDYLVKNKGYSYEDAQQLMAPRIAAYAAQEKAENRRMADSLINEMQGMKIDSPEYRQAAFQLYRLDPKMGEFMLKEGIGPREQYLRGWKREDAVTARQQKREDALFSNELNFNNKMRWLQAQNANTQQQYVNKVQQLMNYAGLDEKTAWLTVFGFNRGNNALANTGAVTDKDYKVASDQVKALEEEQAELDLANPGAKLSPEKQQMYNDARMVLNLYGQQRNARLGIGGQQKQAQGNKVNFNDYYSLKPAIDNLIEKRGGKFDAEIARFIRHKAGIGADNKDPNEFLNQIFEKTYGFRG